MNRAYSADNGWIDLQVYAPRGSGMIICNEMLEKTCKNIIETILTCLESATKGTVYRIGPIPDLLAIRITSGIRKNGGDEIQWGLPAVSDYNPPGKLWEQYKDRPGHVLEAMGWCVEQQRSWTADNPYDDIRSVGKQMRGEIEDCHHMEPVLVRKVDLYGSRQAELEYPKNWKAMPIWQDSEYVVAAVIKIHFQPGSLHAGDRSTKVIKELSRTLGTELISLHLRETLFQAQKTLTRQRLRSCEILAHELRNTITKLSFALSATNAQMSVIREEWEALMRQALPELEWKDVVIERLNELIRLHLPQLNSIDHLAALGKELLSEQEELARLPLLPEQGENWLKNKIKPKWQRLLAETKLWNADDGEIVNLFEQVKESFWIGADKSLAERVDIPRDIRDKWSRLAYAYITVDNVPILEEVLELLDDPRLSIPHKSQTIKVLKALKALLEVLPQVEERANRIILSLRDGSLSDELQMEPSSINLAVDAYPAGPECSAGMDLYSEKPNNDWV